MMKVKNLFFDDAPQGGRSSQVFDLHISEIYNFELKNNAAKYATYVCTGQTGYYLLFEAERKERKGSLTFYVDAINPHPTNFQLEHPDRPFRHISTTHNIIDLMLPDKRRPKINLGIIRGTIKHGNNDACICFFDNGYKEMTVAIIRNGANRLEEIWQHYCDRDFDEDIATLRMLAEWAEDLFIDDPDTPLAA